MAGRVRGTPGWVLKETLTSSTSSARVGARRSTADAAANVAAKYISSNSTKNKLGSLDFLFNHLIKNTFSNKSFFDFGNSNEENGEKLNKGLMYWKEGFGAKSVSQDFYKIETLNFINLDNLFI